MKSFSWQEAPREKFMNSSLLKRYIYQLSPNFRPLQKLTQIATYDTVQYSRWQNSQNDLMHGKAMITDDAIHFILFACVKNKHCQRLTRPALHESNKKGFLMQSHTRHTSYRTLFPASASNNSKALRNLGTWLGQHQACGPTMQSSNQSNIDLLRLPMHKPGPWT